jgi:hypothetical protein
MSSDAYVVKPISGLAARGSPPHSALVQTPRSTRCGILRRSASCRLLSTSAFEGDDLTSATRLAKHVQEHSGTFEPPLVQGGLDGRAGRRIASRSFRLCGCGESSTGATERSRSAVFAYLGGSSQPILSPSNPALSAARNKSRRLQAIGRVLMVAGYVGA